MNRSFGIGILILCFGLSSVNLGLATQVIDIPPIIVQPEDLREISQQMLSQDRIYRDQELAARGLMDEDQKLTNTALARQQDAALNKISQTMVNYREYLLSHGRAGIAANSREVSQYQELIALTEKVDAMKAVFQTPQLKDDVIEKNYKILTELKDEMTALNKTLQAKEKMIKQPAQADELKNQGVLAEKIRDLKLQLQDKDNQITAMKTKIRSGQGTQAQADALKEQLEDQQNKADFLKRELDVKIAQSNQMTLMMADYQKKLESKNSAYNEQTRQVLAYKNAQAQMEGQIADLNARLQEKEAQVVKIKKDMYDLQGSAGAKDIDAQSKDINFSIMQQKITNLTAELALERKKLGAMPSSDELKFLRTGFDKATAQLKQKDAMLSQIKVNADEYESQFKKQSQEFQSLKDQLQDAQDEIGRKNEDLKYKDMEIARLKERSKMSKPHENKGEALPFSKNDTAGQKLKQALDEIDQQGRMINILTQKLQECGQSVDFTKDAGK